MDNEKHREYAALIHESGIHLLDVVNDVLDMSKIETGNFEIYPEPVDLAEMTADCCRLVESQAVAAGLRIETDLPHSMPEVMADRRACKQILLNLLSNAVKFSKPGGRIVVGAYRDGAGAALYVADEGPGVPEDERERIFDPFYTTKDPGKGTGLGLAIVARTVHDAGGVVWVDRAREGGAVFKVFLPQAEAVDAHSGR